MLTTVATKPMSAIKSLSIWFPSYEAINSLLHFRKHNNVCAKVRLCPISETWVAPNNFWIIVFIKARDDPKPPAFIIPFTARVVESYQITDFH